MLLSPAELKSLIDGTESCPHRLLGHHSIGGGGTVVRGFFPGAIQCEIVKKQSKRGLKMTLLHELGLFERTFKEKELFR
jgi:hypothetical protein